MPPAASAAAGGGLGAAGGLSAAAASDDGFGPLSQEPSSVFGSGQTEIPPSFAKRQAGPPVSDSADRSSGLYSEAQYQVPPSNRKPTEEECKKLFSIESDVGGDITNRQIM